MALFEWYDYLIFALTLAISLAIGIYFAAAGGGQRTVKEYLLGNRKLGVLPVGASIGMSYMSAIVVIGGPAEVYTNGIERFSGDFVGMLGIGLAVAFVPMFYRLKISSVFQYVKMRFPNRGLEIVCTIMLLVAQIIYMGLVFYAPGVAMEAVTPIPYYGVALLAGSIGIIYTTIGGMKSVVWTDLVQSFILLVGMIVIVVMGTIKVGGPTEVYNSLYNSGRLHSIRYTADPMVRTNLWISLTWAVLQGLSYGVQQTSVQRYCSAPTLGKAQGSLILAAPLTGIVIILGFLVGAVIFAYYDILGCDPLQTGQASSPNTMLIIYVISALRVPGLPGVMVATLFAGSLSSVSSSINAMAAVTWNHFLEPKFHAISERRKALANKILSLIYGALGIGFSFLVHFMGGNILLIGTGIFSASLAPLMCVVLVGALLPFANWKGTLTACVITFPLMLITSLGNSFYFPHREGLDRSVENCWKYNLTVIPSNPNATAFDPETVPGIFRLSTFLYMPIGVGAFFVIAIVVSLMTGGLKDRKWVRRDLYVPFKSFLFPFCCPDRGAPEIEAEEKTAGDTDRTNGYHNMAFEPTGEKTTQNGAGGHNTQEIDLTRM